LAKAAKSKKLAIEEVREYAEYLKDRGSGRMADYAELEKVYGIEFKDGDQHGYFANVKTRQKQWWERTDGKDFPVNVNLLHQIVEDTRTYMGMDRSIRCMAPGPEKTDEDYANNLERGYYHLWREWYGPIQMSLMGHLCGVYGSAVATVSWSESRRIPIGQMRSPKNFYALADPDDPFSLAAAVFITKKNPRAIKLQYGVDVSGDEVEVIDWYDVNQRIRIIQGVDQPVINDPNPIGEVPVFVIPGILLPDSIFGGAPLMRGIPIHNEINRLYSLEAEVLHLSVRAPTVVNDPINVPENWKWGEDAVIEVGPNGGVGKASLGNIDPQLFFHRIADMKENLGNVTDFSKVQRGEVDGSIVTGKGVHALQAPGQSRMEIRNQTADLIVTKWLKCGMKTLARKRKTILPAYGKNTRTNSTFSFQFDPKTVVEDWNEVLVYRDNASYIDRQSLFVSMLQALRSQNPAQQGISQRRFIEMSPFTEDTEAEITRIYEEFTQGTQAMLAATQPAAPAGPAGASAEEQAYAAERGANPPAGGLPAGPAPEGGEAPPTGEAGAMPPAEAMSQGAPGGADILPAVADFFRSIPKLKGQVFLLGGILNGDISTGIEVYITDPNDKATIVNALKKDIPGLMPPDGPGVVFWTEPRSGKMLEVTPGTSGYTPQGDESPTKMQAQQEMGDMAGPVPGMMGGPGGGPSLGGEAAQLGGV
jgi:hypothetical protein